MLVHELPDPLDCVEVGTVGRQEVQLESRVFRNPSFDGGTGMIPSAVQNDVDDIAGVDGEQIG